MRAVILAGGKGTRLMPYTSVFPKSLAPLGSKPILEILIHQLKSNGVNHITLCVNHLAHIIKAYFKDGKECGVKIDYSYETKELGTVGPLTLVKSLPKTFFVVNSDILATTNYKELLDTHINNKALLTSSVYNQRHKIGYGVFNIEKDEVVGYKEKPNQSFPICAGSFVYDKKILSLIKRNEFLNFPQLMNLLLTQEKKISLYQVKGTCIDIGKPENYQKAIKTYIRNSDLFLNNQ